MDFMSVALVSPSKVDKVAEHLLNDSLNAILISQ